MKITSPLTGRGIFLAALFCLLATLPLAAQGGLDGVIAGRHYIVAFPDTTENTTDNRFPNTRMTNSAILHLYSAVDTRVTLTAPGYNRTVSVQGGEFTIVDLTGDAIHMSSPIVDTSGKVMRRGIEIDADEPIIVYCYLLNRFGTEAWTALPVDVWGTEYFAAALPGETIQNVSPGGEFDYNKESAPAPAEILVIAAYDDTRVTISSQALLSGAPAINNVLLNAGEVYQVQSLVDTSVYVELQGDLGGSRITSTRPIAVISGNTRAQVRSMVEGEGLANNSFKNMLIEWLPPMAMHGTGFVFTPTWDARRRTEEAGEIAADKRKFEVMRVYGTAVGTTAGYELRETGTIPFTIGSGKFRHAAINAPRARYMATDKPAMAMMNSSAVIKYNGTTTGFGGYIGRQYDAWGAYMTEIVPVERWTSFAPYFAPEKPAGMEHYINVVTDSAHINDVYMENGARFIFNGGAVEGTSYVWGSMVVNPGLGHSLRGRNGAKFTGHVYGLYRGHEEYRPGGTRRMDDSEEAAARRGDASDGELMHPSDYEEYLAVAYGYPLVSARTEALSTEDSLEITSTMSYAELTVGLRILNVDPSGNRSIVLERNVNARIRSIDSVSPRQLNVVVAPIDPSRDASATLVITSNATKQRTVIASSSTRYVAYNYSADRVRVLPEGTLDFGTRGNDDEAVLDLVVSNPMDRPLGVRSLVVAGGNEGYSVINVAPSAPDSLAPGEEMRVTVKFTSGTGPSRTMRDTLLVRLGAYDYRVALQARVSAPTGVERGPDAPANILHRNDPNPFSGSTTIRFTLARAAKTRLDLYSATGEKVATLVDEYRDAGEHAVVFDATGLAAGSYYYRISSGEWSATSEMIVR
jgi:hypothetical protein